MPAQTGSIGVPWPFNVDSVTITRRTPGATPPDFDVVTVFDGIADLQEGGGSTYVSPGGAVEEIDARLFIDQNAVNPLPTVQVKDIVTNAADGKEFSVVAVAMQTFLFPHLEIMLKRGPLPYHGGPK